MKIAAKAGADIVGVDVMQGGTGAGPTWLQNILVCPPSPFSGSDEALIQYLTGKVNLVAAGSFRMVLTWIKP